MTTKATICIFDEEQEDGRIAEKMTIDYEVEKDEEGNVLVKSNVIGMSRIVFELFRFGVLERFSRIFVPAPDIEQQVQVTGDSVVGE